MRDITDHSQTAGAHANANDNIRLASNAVEVRFEEVGKRYHPGEMALSGINLHIAAGEFVVLVGPSGCGKSSLLRMLAGLESISQGRMLINAQVVNDISPRERDIAMVFQDYALYPHKTVYDNLAFGLQVRGVHKAEIATRVQEVAHQLKIGDLLQRKPAALSGGQRQRVAIGRALVRKARLFLFDEPLSNLDVKLRNEMRLELKKLHQQFGITTLYVTHDQVEAMTLGDRIAVMSSQGIEQYGTPQQIYGQPRTTFVAEFVGSPTMNLLTLPVIAGLVQQSDTASPTSQPGAMFGRMHLRLPALAHVLGGTSITQVILGIRPEHIQRVLIAGTETEGTDTSAIEEAHVVSATQPSSPTLAAANTLQATVSFIEPLGAETIVTLEYAGHMLRARWAPDQALQSGQRVSFRISTRHCLWFDARLGINLDAIHQSGLAHA